LHLATRRQFFSGTLAWSPDQHWLAYVDARYDSANQHWVEAVKLVPADGEQSPRTLLTHVGTSDSDPFRPWLHWMPDGRHIAVIGHGGPQTEIWYVDVQARRITYHYKTNAYLDMCWSPTTDHFLIVTDNNFNMMTPGGAPLDLSFIDPPIWQVRPGSSEPCAWSPDGTKLTLIYSQHRQPPGVKVIDFVERKVSDIQVRGPYDLLMSYWSPDSRMLAIKTYTVSRDPNDIFIYDMSTSTPQPVFYQKDLEFRDWLILPPS
jgi:Tol biopolymer transport system component